MIKISRQLTSNNITEDFFEGHKVAAVGSLQKFCHLSNFWIPQLWNNRCEEFTIQYSGYKIDTSLGDIIYVKPELQGSI